MAGESLGDLTARLRVDTSDLKRAGSEAAGFGSIIKGVLGAEAIQSGIEHVIDFGKESVGAFQKSEAANLLLNQAFAKSPQLIHANVGAFQDYAEQLSHTTTFSKTQTEAGIGVLANFNLTGAQLKTLIPLVQDYAARTGTDVTTAAEVAGKAILGKGRALAAVGGHFKDLKDPQKNFGELTDILSAKVGGFAVIAGQTTAGKLAILRNSFEEIQVKVGAALMPVLTTLANFAVTVLMPAIAKVSDFLSGTFGPVIAAIAAAIQTHAGPAMDGFAKIWRENVMPILTTVVTWVRDQVIPRVEALANSIKTNVIPPVIDFAEKLKPVFDALVLVSKWIIEHVLDALKWLTDHFNILAPILEIILIGFAAFSAFTFIAGLIDGIAAAFALLDLSMLPVIIVFGLIGGAIYLLVTHFNVVKGAIGTIMSAIEGFGVGVYNFLVDTFNNVGNFLIGMINGLFHIINSLTGVLSHIGINIPKIGDLASLNAQRIMSSSDQAAQASAIAAGVHSTSAGSNQTSGGRHMAEGGIVPARPGGTQITAGEGGRDEAIIPLPAKGMGGITVNVYGSNLSPHDVGRELAWVLRTAS